VPALRYASVRASDGEERLGEAVVRARDLELRRACAAAARARRLSSAAVNPTRPLRLAFLADVRSIHTLRWASFFAARGHQVLLLAGGNEEVGEALPEGIEVHRYDRRDRGRMPLTSTLLARRSLRRLLPTLNVDVLHAHYLASYGWLGRLVGSHPYVVTAWGSDLLLAPRRSFRARIKVQQAIRHADLVTVPSKHLFGVAIRAGARPERTRRVPFGVDTTEFSPGDPDRMALERAGLTGHRILFSPRAIRPIYRQDTVVSALVDLPADVVVVVPGRSADPASRAQIEASARALGVADRVRIVDEIEHGLMLSLFRGAAVVVSVPESDGLPVSVLEGMACAVPVIVSDLPGPREALGPLADRLAVPHDDAAALAVRVNEVLELAPSERDSLVQTLRRRVVDHFDFESWMLAMEGLYLTLRRG
jgi:L-malate glycosyltransferase